MVQRISEIEIAKARRKAGILIDMEEIIKTLPDRIAESMPAEHREHIRSHATQHIAAGLKRIREKLGADEIEAIARHQNH